MKNKILAILTACLILLNYIPVYANTNVGSNVIVDADSIEEIKALEEDLINEINSTFVSKNIYIESNNIDYSKIITLYTDIELYENGKPNHEQMQEAINHSKYVYYLPIEYNGKTIMVCFQQGEELTDEDREKLSADTVESLEKNVGKWHIVSMGVKSDIIDYKGEVQKALEENNIENSHIYFVNELTQTITIGALICSDDFDDVQFKIIKQFESKTEGDGGSTLDKNVLHSYDEIKAIADSEIEMYQTGYDGAWGATPTTDNNKIIIITAVSGAAILAIAVTAICIVKKKKNTKVLDEN